MRAKAYTRGLPMLPALVSLAALAAATRVSAATSPSPVIGHMDSPTPGPAGAQPIGIVVT
jgi:hypothetical protein